MKTLAAIATALSSLCVSAASAASSDPSATPCAADFHAGAELSLGGLGLSLSPCVYRSDWRAATPGVDYDAKAEPDGSVRFSIADCDDSGARVEGRASFSQDGDGAIVARYEATPDRDFEANGLCVRCYLPTAFFGGKVRHGGNWSDIPAAKPARPQVATGVADSLEVVSADGAKRIAFAADRPVFMMLQDNREWNHQETEIRIVVAGAPFRGGETARLGLTISTDRPFALSSGVGQVRIEASDDWIPMRPYADIKPGSALDFSRLVPRDEPAGGFGRVIARGDHFEFEGKPGETQRFYGVNLCFGANFGSWEEAQGLADRLARVGYNAVRMHHYDGGLVEGSADGTTLNPKRLEEFDNVVGACIARGLYVTTDLFVSRSVPWRAVGVDRDGNIPMDEYKLLAPVHEGVFNNLLEFSRQLLSHVNPRTGRSYAEEPALAWLSLINEDNPGNFGGDTLSRHAEWRDAWAEWLARHRADQPEVFAGVGDGIPSNLWNRDREAVFFSMFLAEKESEMARRLRAFLRDEMKCGALITDMNSWMNPVIYQHVRSADFDYVDDHFYVDHPSFLGQPWRLPSKCPNENPFTGPARGAQGAVFTRLLDKPFTITEYNYSAPGRYRGVGGIATGAMAALQDWAGVWRFAWSHSREGAFEPARVALDYFNMGGDPLSLAAERASLCLFLRGDLEPLERAVVVKVPPSPISPGGYDPINRPSWPWAAWYVRLGTTVAARAPSKCFRSESYDTLYRKDAAEVAQWIFGSATVPPAGPAEWKNPVSVDGGRGAFAIRTPRTCGGFAPNGRIAAGVLRADVGDVPATVWASSLDGAPLSESKRILLTHLTDVQNTGALYADSRLQVLQAWGGLPHLMRNGRAKVALRLGAGDFEVRALDADGSVRRAIESKTEDGVLQFTADVALDRDAACYLYEIVRR